MNLTLIVPYYRNQAMLERQLAEWRAYPKQVEIILVDDGSPEPATPIVEKAILAGEVNVRVLRILPDIPWNRGGARNLGTMKASNPWVMHVDIDHIAPATTMQALVAFTPEPGTWYRFARFRRGKADFTRKKDDLPPECEYGQIHPHMDSYLCEKQLYMSLGGYDEDYSGGLGGGTPFVRELQSAARMLDLPPPYMLEVHTTDSVKDASDIFLSRDTSRFKELQKRKKREGLPKKPMCQFPWIEVSFS